MNTYVHTLSISWHGIPFLNNCASITIERVWKLKKIKNHIDIYSHAWFISIYIVTL